MRAVTASSASGSWNSPRSKVALARCSGCTNVPRPRVFVLEKGTIALGVTPEELRGDPRLETPYMGETQVEEPTAAGDHKEEL